tara:strand:- start:992 stop:2518 length:1527 start_codon:yes stop_codon:yes gene_type:complete
MLGRLFFIWVLLNFKRINKNLEFKDLNFKKIDFCNYKQIKIFIFKNEFYKLKNKYVQSFDFLNFSKNLGGRTGINISKKSIIDWYKLNKFKIFYPWSEDLTSKRLINILYNYEFINSSLTLNESKLINKITQIHMLRVINEIKNKSISKVNSYNLLAYFLSVFLLKKFNKRDIVFLNIILNYQIDNLGMHKSYNVLEHSKYLNNLNELKNIFLYFRFEIPVKFESTIIKMTSILNEYFHKDGTIPLFNGANNNYTFDIYNSLNKEEYLKSRTFNNINNGIAFYSDKNKKLFFDVVQPNKESFSNNLNAGTLSIEFSCNSEKIITNCGSSESFGKNPEYLRYSAAHSTIILQNTNISEIKENNPHIKFPQSVTFNSNKIDDCTFFEGSHNGYFKKFNKIIKRNLTIENNKNKLYGEDILISKKEFNKKIIYHIRFHLNPGISFNFTNSRRNIILKTQNKNIWLFKSDNELAVEDSILVDKNLTIPTKQIVIKGVINKNKIVRKWSLEKI